MDVISHLLIGELIQVAAKVERRRDQVLTVVFAALPDLPMAVVYPLLGQENGRPFWLPAHADWSGLRELHPVWAAAWDLPHSLLFWALVIAPLVLLFKLPRVTLLAYLSHIFVDIFTHMGEWSLRLLYPLDSAMSGFTDAWTWSLAAMAAAWVVLAALAVVVLAVQRRGGGRPEWRAHMP